MNTERHKTIGTIINCIIAILMLFVSVKACQISKDATGISDKSNEISKESVELIKKANKLIVEANEFQQKVEESRNKEIVYTSYDPIKKELLIQNIQNAYDLKITITPHMIIRGHLNTTEKKDTSLSEFSKIVFLKLPYIYKMDFIHKEIVSLELFTKPITKAFNTINNTFKQHNIKSRKTFKTKRDHAYWDMFAMYNIALSYVNLYGETILLEEFIFLNHKQRGTLSDAKEMIKKKYEIGNTSHYRLGDDFDFNLYTNEWGGEYISNPNIDNTVSKDISRATKGAFDELFALPPGKHFTPFMKGTIFQQKYNLKNLLPKQ